MKPIIVVTSNYIDNDEFFVKLGLGAYKQDYLAVANDYFNAIIESGGVPVAISPNKDKEYLDSILEICDGLLVTGGNDVDSLLYNERPIKELGTIIESRDFSDIYLTKKALEKNIPFLGICRGIQILNVACNGSLIQDIPSEGYLDHTILSFDKWKEVHSLKLEENSKLREIYGKDEIYVNSFHHQNVKKLGFGLKSVAISEDGLCEACEYEKNDFALAVQYHPEMMFEKNKDHLKIFKAFVQACK